MAYVYDQTGREIGNFPSAVASSYQNLAGYVVSEQPLSPEQVTQQLPQNPTGVSMGAFNPLPDQVPQAPPPPANDTVPQQPPLPGITPPAPPVANDTLPNPQAPPVDPSQPPPASTQPPVQQPPAQQPPSGATPPATPTTGIPGTSHGGPIQMRGPNGVQSVTDLNQVAALLAQGFVPIHPDGSPMAVEDFQGGKLLDGQPINYHLTGQYLPGQEAALAGRASKPTGTGAGPDFTPHEPTGSNPGAGWTPNSGSNGYGLDYPGETIDGQRVDPYSIPSITMPDAPTVGSEFSPIFSKDYSDFMGQIGNKVGSQYDYNTPVPAAAQMNQAGVPQPTAQQQGTSPELQNMLNGQGYSPEILAQMRAQATEGASQAGRLELGATKRMLGQAGLSSSPAGAAVAGDVARRTGEFTASALRDVSLNNAETGMENQRLGLGYQTQIGQSNMQAANEMALNNANRLFSSMSQNLANQQGANMQYNENQNQQRMTQAGATSNYLANAGSSFQNASLNKATNAENTNVSNQMSRQQQNAELERQRALANQSTMENRNQQAVTAMWNPGGLTAGNYQPSQGFNPLQGGA